MNQTLKVQDFEVSVRLGCSSEERKYFQPVRFVLELKYADSVLGAKTDNLADATDYVKLTEIMKTVASQKSFNLIEHLHLSVFQELISYCRSQKTKGLLFLSAHKVNVPIENLKHGVVFSCSAEL